MSDDLKIFDFDATAVAPLQSVSSSAVTIT